MTQTRKEALIDLLEWVIEGAARPYVIEEAAAKLWDFKVFPLVAKSYDSSLDAARALHEAVLPFGHDTFDAFSLSGEVVLRRGRPVDRFYGFADCDPARAWLITIIKALIAQEPDQ